MQKSFDDIAIRSVAAASGKKQHDVAALCSSFLDERHIARLIKTLGFKKVREIPLSMTCADMCVHIAADMLKNEGISPDEIGALIFVSQTNDTLAPATVFTMQHALGLSSDCYLNNLINGCAGSVHGIFEGCALIAAGVCDKALICFGDTYCKVHTLEESTQKANAALFGDGAGAVLLERKEGAPRLFFNLSSHGELSQVICDHKFSERHERLQTAVKEGVLAPEILAEFKDTGIKIDGTAIASFAIDTVIPEIRSLMTASGFADDDLSLYLLHQANKTVLKAVALNLGVPVEKIPFTSENTGNTSSASLALAICESESVKHEIKKAPVVLSAFGVGMHAASVLADLRDTHIYDAVYF